MGKDAGKRCRDNKQDSAVSCGLVCRGRRNQALSRRAVMSVQSLLSNTASILQHGGFHLNRGVGFGSTGTNGGSSLVLGFQCTNTSITLRSTYSPTVLLKFNIPSPSDGARLNLDQLVRSPMHLQVEPVLHSASMTTDLAPFNPSCDHAIDVAIKLLELVRGDLLGDIGCGDGRFLFTAAQRVPGIRCIGVEHNEELYQRAIYTVTSSLPESQQALMDIRQADALSLSQTLATCTKLYLYLLPKGLKAIRPVLDSLPSNVYVVSYMFQIHGWMPIKVDRSTKGSVPVYLYVTE